MRNISLIIMREFKERVYKKSFIITTLLMPLLFAAIGVAPTLIMIFAKGDTKNISVIDQSGVVAQRLESNEKDEKIINGHFYFCCCVCYDSACSKYRREQKPEIPLFHKLLPLYTFNHFPFFNKSLYRPGGIRRRC